MEKTDLKKTHNSKMTFHNRLIASVNRMLRITKNESMPLSDLQIMEKSLPDTFLVHDEYKKMNARLLKLEKLNMEAMRLIHEHRRYV